MYLDICKTGPTHLRAGRRFLVHRDIGMSSHGRWPSLSDGDGQRTRGRVGAYQTSAVGVRWFYYVVLYRVREECVKDFETTWCLNLVKYRRFFLPPFSAG